MQFIKFLKKNLPEKANAQLGSYLKKAEKLSSTNEEEAYLLGIILRKAVLENQIHESMEEQVHHVANNSLQIDYYKQKRKPDFDSWFPFSLIMLIMGLGAIIAGIYMLKKNGYFLEFHSIYQKETIKGGGYMIILGLVFVLGGFLKTKQELQRNKLIPRLKR